MYICFKDKLPTNQKQTFLLETCYFLNENSKDCDSKEEKYYYTIEQGIPVCKNITFMGCMDNGNIFKDKESCEMKCMDGESLAKRGKYKK